MIETLAMNQETKNIGNIEKSKENNFGTLKDIGIPESKMSNIEYTLNEGHGIEIIDGEILKEIIPLNIDEVSYKNLSDSGYFADAENKTLLVNNDFWKLPTDVIDDIISDVAISGGEVKTFDFKDKILSLDKYIDKNGNPQFSYEGSFSDAVENAPNKVGVYVHSIDGKAVYVGRAIEARPDQSTSGLNKRLNEHYRGDSNGKPELYQNRDNITTKFIVCDSVSDAKQLEGVLIKKYDTVANGYNKRNEGSA